MSDRPPAATIEKRGRRVSLLWVAPVVAAVALAAFILIEVRAEIGPTITITFDDAAGLEVGADVVHRGVRAGVVRAVRLSEDLARVDVVAELAPHAEGLAAEGSRFWIVRPELSLDRVTGLDTLVGPRYVAVERVANGDETKLSFEGLASAPQDPQTAEDGLLLRLSARSAGSITAGSSVLYRNLRVGRVIGLELANDSTAVEISAVIEPRFAGLVRDNSRFWDASGVGVDFGWFRGLSVAAGSIDSVLRGAISFATPTKYGAVVEDGAVFDIEIKVDEDWLEWEPVIPLPKAAVSAE